jgi:hypothetical protein
MSEQSQHGNPPEHPPAPAIQAVPQQQANVDRGVRKARDRAVYTRQQKGHSLTKHLLFGGIVLWIPAIYYHFSPNHYWHA